MVSFSRKSSAVGPQEDRRHPVNKFERAVCMAITVKDRNICNRTTKFEGTKIASKVKVKLKGYAMTTPGPLALRDCGESYPLTPTQGWCDSRVTTGLL